MLTWVDVNDFPNNTPTQTRSQNPTTDCLVCQERQTGARNKHETRKNILLPHKRFSRHMVTAGKPWPFIQASKESTMTLELTCSVKGRTCRLASPRMRYLKGTIQRKGRNTQKCTLLKGILTTQSEVSNQPIFRTWRYSTTTVYSQPPTTRQPARCECGSHPVLLWQKISVHFLLEDLERIECSSSCPLEKCSLSKQQWHVPAEARQW